MKKVFVYSLALMLVAGAMTAPALAWGGSSAGTQVETENEGTIVMNHVSVSGNTGANWVGSSSLRDGDATAGLGYSSSASSAGNAQSTTDDTGITTGNVNNNVDTRVRTNETTVRVKGGSSFYCSDCDKVKVETENEHTIVGNGVEVEGNTGAQDVVASSTRTGDATAGLGYSSSASSAGNSTSATTDTTIDTGHVNNNIDTTVRTNITDVKVKRGYSWWK